MSDEIVHVSFHDDTILLVEVDGKPHVVLRPALESIGLDVRTQYDKLKKRSWATVGQHPTVGSNGSVRNMTICDVRTFLMLLATIDENQVSPDVRPKLIAYQAEVADAIEAYWYGTYNIKKLYVLDEASKWERMFENWFKSEAARLKIPYPNFVRNYIYERFLPEGVIQEIDKKNPIVRWFPSGRRYKQHQFLTEVKGRAELRERLEAFKAISQACSSKEELDMFVANYTRNNIPAIGR